MWVRRVTGRAEVRTWSLIAAIVALAVFATACGSDDAGETTFSANPETNAAEGATVETSPGEEGRVAQVGDTVEVHYRGTLDDGSEFDSSAGRAPLQFTVGSGQVIGGFDSAVLGMAVGDKKEVRIVAEDAYGERTDERVISVPKEQAPEGLEAGQQVMLGQTPATVIEITDEVVIVDANHPLAGEALTFEIELVSVS